MSTLMYSTSQRAKNVKLENP